MTLTLRSVEMQYVDRSTAPKATRERKQKQNGAANRKFFSVGTLGSNK